MGVVQKHTYYYHPNELFMIDVEIPDMREVEIVFTVKDEDVEKLIAALKQEHQGTLEQMCDAAFQHNMKNFTEFCRMHGIQYHETCNIVV